MKARITNQQSFVVTVALNSKHLKWKEEVMGDDIVFVVLQDIKK
jgi:hypothetical protein